MRSYNVFPLLFWSIVASETFTLPLLCDPDSGIMTTPSFGTTEAIFTVCTQNFINGPPGTVYEVLVDFPFYPAWNTFVYSVDVPANVSSTADVYVCMPMTFHTSGLLGSLNSTSDERITYLEPDSAPPFVVWRFDPGVVGGLVMNAEHVSLLRNVGDGTTEYVSWETCYGPGSLVVEALKGNLQIEFENQARDLKARVEG